MKKQTGAEQVDWDLSDLYTSEEDLLQDLQTADDLADSFAARYQGRVSELDVSELAGALRAFEAILDRLGGAMTYVYLHWSTDTGESARGARLQQVREAYSRTSQRLLFFELEWVQVDDDHAQSLLNDDILSAYRHYLERERLLKKHLLTEPEEKILVEKSVTGRSAWNRLFDEIMGSMRFSLDDELLSQQEVLTKLYDTDRDLRKRAALTFTDGLEEREKELTYIFNTILADMYSDDRLRQYPSWISSRNLGNEVSDEMVEALVQAVTSRYDLVARYYSLKCSALGFDELYDYDRYAPIGEVETIYTWEAARDLVVDAYTDFAPRMGEIARLFFERKWIDAAVKPGKRGGAFSHGAVPSAHPFILLNYTGKIRDVQTLAHELGHGVHQYLSRKQGVLHADTPLTTAETASVFGEMLVFQRLIREQVDPTVRFSMLMGKIDDTIATVFRQIAMNLFEDRIHDVRRNKGELSATQFSDIWLETQQAMFQGSVTLGEHYRRWWSYIPHFLHTPGYVYAYAFGELLVLALYARYLEEGSPFAGKYIRLLEAGGSDWPHVLVGRLGIDLTDLDFWKQGLRAIEELIVQAEALHEQQSVS